MTKTAASVQTLTDINPDVVFEEYTYDITRTANFEHFMDRWVCMRRCVVCAGWCGACALARCASVWRASLRRLLGCAGSVHVLSRLRCVHR